MGQLALHTDVRIAAFHCDAPARCGAVADEWRVVANDEAAECGSETLIGRWVIDARTRPWSRRSLQALRCGTWAAGFCVPGFAYALPSVERPPTGRGSRRSIQFARQAY